MKPNPSENLPNANSESSNGGATAQGLAKLREYVEQKESIDTLVSALELPEAERAKLNEAIAESKAEVADMEHKLSRRKRLTVPVKMYLKDMLYDISPKAVHTILGKELLQDKTLGLNELLDVMQITDFRKFPENHPILRAHPIMLVQDRHALLDAAVRKSLSADEQREWKVVVDTEVRKSKVVNK